LLSHYRELAGETGIDRATGTWLIPGEPGRRLPELCLAAVVITVANQPEPLGTLVYAAGPASVTLASPADVWLLLQLLLISAVGAFWVFLAQRAVLKPITDSEPSNHEARRVRLTLTVRHGSVSLRVLSRCIELDGGEAGRAPGTVGGIALLPDPGGCRSRADQA
jgi:hypothetical protein